MSKADKIAIIRIRGLVNIESGVKDTLTMLGLMKKHTCVIVDNTTSMVGMIKKVKDYVTWGEIDEKTEKLLIEKRLNNKDQKKDGKKKPFFRLHPPRGGFERGGIKKTFNVGGALGPRGDKIIPLIEKMI